MGSSPAGGAGSGTRTKVVSDDQSITCDDIPVRRHLWAKVGYSEMRELWEIWEIRALIMGRLFLGVDCIAIFYARPSRDERSCNLCRDSGKTEFQMAQTSQGAK